MKLKSLINVLMAALTFFTPFTALGNLVKDSAESAAERDAESDVNTNLWVATGGILGVAGSCVLGSAAVAAAYVYQPIPPAERLIGRAPEYVIYYTDAYRSTTRSLRLSASAKGAIGGSLVFFLLGTLKIRPWADFVLW